jgi:hypothetical protein
MAHEDSVTITIRCPQHLADAMREAAEKAFAPVSQYARTVLADELRYRGYLVD